MTMVTSQISISLDGFVAGPDQSVEDPLGKGGRRLHEWHIGEGRRHEADDRMAERILAGNGAYVMGRNMFGPIRGEWEGDWRGWWGEEPPYHAPVFVLTHHPRDPVVVDGGTTFHLVTDGVEAALEQARAVPGDADIAVAGGASTVNQYLAAGLLDELRLHIAPVVLGTGERLFDGVSGRTIEQVSVQPARRVTHATYRLSAAS